jgi:hypothetical protein
MADLVQVVRASDGKTLIIDIATAQTMRDAGELVDPGATVNRMTLADVFGADFEPDPGLSGGA